jgi:hypothetical protein
MIKGSKQLGFTMKPRDTAGIPGKLFRQRLDRNIALEFPVLRPINLSHPSLAKPRNNFAMP